MPTITTASGTELYAQVSGTGRPVVLIHGWPLSGRMWEPQIPALTAAGFQAVTYDRRGFGQSDFPWDGYDYDTFAADLDAVLTGLDLTDVALVGFSMGGGEVARYLARYGSARVSRVAFVASVTPFLLQTDDNPDGVPGKVFDGIREKILEDRPAFLRAFGKMFFNDGLLTHPVSQEQLDYAWSLAVMADPHATYQCATAFSATDFRADLAAVTVPTLIVHGSADQTVPIKNSGDRTARMLPQAQYEVIDGAPHGLYLTHADRFNAILLDFLQR